MIKKLSFLLLFISLCFAGLNRPTWDQELNYIHVLFEWDQEPDADYYHIMVDTLNNDTFGNPLLYDSTNTTLYLDTETIDWQITYYWTVRVVRIDGSMGEWIDAGRFSTIEAKYGELDVTIYQDELIQKGLTLHSGNSKAIAFNKYGTEVWNYHNFPWMVLFIDEYGVIYGFRNINDPNAALIKINFGLEILWSLPNELANMHEFKPMPNGNYMGMLKVDTLGPIPSDIGMTQSFRDLGFAADDTTAEFPWFGQKIVEWNEDREVVWSWNPFDHYTMEDYDDIYDTWTNAYQQLQYDWNHSNAFHYDEAESVIYYSVRHLSRISKISYPSGEVIWNMGLPEPYMSTGAESICSDLLFSFQHHIQLLDNGHLLFFDNGNLSEELFGYDNPISRVLEIDVIGDSSCDVIWEYELPPNLFGTAVGSAELLENGNRLIYTRGDGPEPTVLEVTPNQELVWTLSPISPEIWFYRAWRIPSLHPDAFSVVFDHYRSLYFGTDVVNGIVIDDENDSLSFTIHNESGYTQPYVFALNEDSGWFDSVSDTITIMAGSNLTFTLGPEIQPDSITNISLTVTPLYHEYAIKELNYNVYRISGTLKNDNKDFPGDFLVYQNYPNPFNPMTTLHFELHENTMVTITIYDMEGRVVKTIMNNQQEAGYKSVQWNATNDNGIPVSAGIYMYTIDAGEFRQTKKMVLLK